MVSLIPRFNKCLIHYAQLGRTKGATSRYRVVFLSSSRLKVARFFFLHIASKRFKVNKESLQRYYMRFILVNPRKCSSTKSFMPPIFLLHNDISDSLCEPPRSP